MTPIPNETLLRLGLHISSTRYLEDKIPRFTEVNKYVNTGFECEVVEDKSGKEDSEEAVTNSVEEASRKRARHKVKRDVLRARALLLITVLGLSVPLSTSIPVPGSSTAMPGLSAPTFASVFVPGSSAVLL